jgi:tRNA G18 (ribose-2'-O)-methylase SpoU
MSKHQKLSMDDLGRMNREEYRSSEKNRIILVLDNVRSLNNVGSVFRTADSFLIEAVYLCGVTGVPPHKDIEKTALGATQTVSWKYFKTTAEAIVELRKQDYFIAAVEQAKHSMMLNRFEKPTRPLALIAGNEVYGVEQEVIDQSDACIEIPQFGTKHSLNVAVSVGIVLWEMLR